MDSQNNNTAKRGANRRKLTRINTQMRVDIYRHRFLGGWRFVARAKALDYNRYGLGITSPVRLMKGGAIKLDIYAPGMTLRQVSAEVVSCRRVGQAYRMGVRTYQNLKELSGVDTQHHQIRYLAGIEELLPEM